MLQLFWAWVISVALGMVAGLGYVAWAMDPTRTCRRPRDFVPPAAGKPAA